MRHAIATIAVVTTLGCALLPAQSARAQAQDAPNDDALAARHAFLRGRELFDKRDFRAAALQFETAFRLSPSANAAYNAANAWVELGGEGAREADALAKALSIGGLPPDAEADARGRLTKLEATLGVVVVEAPAGSHITIGETTDAEPPLRVHMNPGEAAVTIKTTAGAMERHTVVVRAGQTSPLKIEGPPPPSSPALMIAGWTTLGVSVALGAVAIGLGVKTLSVRDEYDTGGHQDSDLRDSALAFRIGTNVAWFSAGAFAVAGSIMLIVDATRKPSASKKPDVAVGLGAAELTWHW